MSGHSPIELATVLGIAPPTPEQAAVIAAPMIPAGVVAGAGSGKTATMAARVVWLVANGRVRPEGVLGLTFTRKAAAELSSRVRRRLNQLRGLGLIPGACPSQAAGSPPGCHLPDDTPGGEPTVSTYHSYAGRLVAEHALREAREPTARLISPAVSWQLAARVVGSYAGPMDAVGKGPAWVIDAVLALAGELAEHLREPAELRRELERWRRRAQDTPGRRSACASLLLSTSAATLQLLPLVEAYQSAKAARMVLDYGDQVALAARIAARHTEVGEMERARFPVVLLDEYQDTGHAQRELLRALFGDGHPVTAVGDPCQSIYGWRGASAGGLRRFPAHFGRAGAPTPVRHLTRSFRNGSRILDVANRLAEPLRDSDPDVPILRPAEGCATLGRAECALLETQAEEADWVADHIADTLGRPAEQPLRPGEVAVLCRKRSQFPALRRALETRGLPVEVVGLGGLLTVPEVLDVVSVLRVLEDTDANPSLLRLLTGQRLRLGPSDLVALGGRARVLAASPTGTDLSHTGSLVEALDDPGPPSAYSDVGYSRLGALGSQLRALRQRLDQPLPDLVADVERTLELHIEVMARPGAQAVSARADLDAFADATAEFAGEEEEPTLRAFLSYLRAAEEEEFGLETGRVGSSDSVKVMTVHAAKGLEWPVVAIPGLAAGASSGIFPARPPASTKWTHNAQLLPFSLRGDAVDLPVLGGLGRRDAAAFDEACGARDRLEERRLAYVAVTRAAQVVLCSGFWWGEGKTALGPSVFLTEVRDVVVAAGDTVPSWCPPPDVADENPQRVTAASTCWPADPSGPVHEAVVAGARLVLAEMATPSASPAPTGTPEAAKSPEPLETAEVELAARWRQEVALLLAEQAGKAQASSGARQVVLPTRLTVTGLVGVAHDPGAVARGLRRPLPQPPAPAARRGSAFHAWVESHYGQLSLLDLDDLPGDPDAGLPGGEELAALQAAFRRSCWWHRTPLEVEVPFEAQLGQVVVRGRIDAAFRDADGGWTVIDWKTGGRPGPAAAIAGAVQLAVYRLAWSALREAPLERVRAAFHYVADGLTVRPADLLDGAGLQALIEALPVSAAEP